MIGLYTYRKQCRHVPSNAGVFRCRFGLRCRYRCGSACRYRPKVSRILSQRVKLECNYGIRSHTRSMMALYLDSVGLADTDAGAIVPLEACIADWSLSGHAKSRFCPALRPRIQKTTWRSRVLIIGSNSTHTSGF